MDTIRLFRDGKGKLVSSSSLLPLSRPIVATMGVFDGVHKGHLFLIQQVIAEAKKQNLPSALITFTSPPISIIAPDKPLEQLHSLDEKVERLQASGVDYLILLPFDTSLMCLSAEDFMQQVLKDILGVTTLLMGYDHHFGRPSSKGEQGSDYALIGEKVGIKILTQEPVYEEESTLVYSSSNVRSFLKNGQLSEANGFLGYPYSFAGEVITGLGIGKTFGYPTANISPDKNKLIPKDGVYAVLIEIRKKLYKGMLYIGKRPTIAEGLKRTIEVNIFDFSDNLYDETVRLFFIAYTRGEAKFNSHNELIARITQDFHEVQAILKDDPTKIIEGAI